MAIREEDFVQASFVLLRSDIKDLEDLAKAEGVNVNDILRRAIATYKYFREQERAGKTILLRDEKETYTRVRLP